ncbi:MAG TPA: anthranilate synthase component I [Planctomycetota bacterium]|nr:anthranilate synthase component I [Planctomycetota bacterium]
MHCPTFAEFQRLAGAANVVPVYRQLLADTLTPVSAFQKLNVGGHGFLLESVTGGERIGRYSLLGAEPKAILRATRNTVETVRGGQTTRHESGDPLRDIEELLALSRPVRVPGLDCFAGGVVGYLAYDVVRYVESLPGAPPDDRGLPDYYMMACDTLVVFDHVFKTIKVVSNARLDDRSARQAYDEAVAAIDAVVERLRTPVTTLTDDIRPTGDITLHYDSNISQADYEDVVLRCKEYIKAGDIIQVVPSQRLAVETHAHPFDVYRTLRVVNPSPYMFYLKLGDLTLVGASPEVMVKLEGDKITLRPIAGTRRRGATPEEDDALAAELLADPKERAEHVMLLDLGRNDVGRVSRYGTVHVTEQMVIERYSHVMHITSNVEGRLDRERYTPFDVLRACLPAGTVSGAPKVRAMEIIDEMERTRRGPYAGAVGAIDYFGDINTCITLRTIVFHGGKAYVQAGGGIVADSVPALEYEETISKARALLRAIEVAEQQITRGASE